MSHWKTMTGLRPNRQPGKTVASLHRRWRWTRKVCRSAARLETWTRPTKRAVRRKPTSSQAFEDKESVPGGTPWRRPSRRSAARGVLLHVDDARATSTSSSLAASRGVLPLC